MYKLLYITIMTFMKSALSFQYGYYEQSKHAMAYNYYTPVQVHLPIYGESMRKLMVNTPDEASTGSYFTNDYAYYSMVKNNTIDDNDSYENIDSDANNTDITIQLSPPYPNRSSYNSLCFPLLILLSFVSILL